VRSLCLSVRVSKYPPALPRASAWLLEVLGGLVWVAPRIVARQKNPAPAQPRYAYAARFRLLGG